MQNHCGIIVTPEDFRGVDWVAKLKESGLGLLELHSGGGPSADVLKILGEYGQEPFRQRLRKAALDWEYENHAANLLLDRALFAQHPEYFPWSQYGGRRFVVGNWCISNPELRRLLAANARKLASALPSSTHRHYFWAADFGGAWCHCPQCAGMNLADQNLASMNAIIPALRQQDPQAELAYLSYNDGGQLPERVSPENGIFLEFAPYTRCPRHAINDPDCACNRGFWNALRKNLTIFDPAKAKILEYWLDASFFSHYRKPAVPPVLNRDILRRDLEAYLKLGIRSFATFAVYMDGEYFRTYGNDPLAMFAETLHEFDLA